MLKINLYNQRVTMFSIILILTAFFVSVHTLDFPFFKKNHELSKHYPPLTNSQQSLSNEQNKNVGFVPPIMIGNGIWVYANRQQFSYQGCVTKNATVVTMMLYAQLCSAPGGYTTMYIQNQLDHHYFMAKGIDGMYDCYVYSEQVSYRTTSSKSVWMSIDVGLVRNHWWRLYCTGYYV